MRHQRPAARRSSSGLTPLSSILEAFSTGVAPSTHDIAPGSLESAARRQSSRELERIIQRALWRAERRGRRVPRHVRESASFVNGQRRRIAYEIARALLSLGAGLELARALAARACDRFPANGVVVANPRGERPPASGRPRPRETGTAPRQTGENPRAVGTNPRAVGKSPRQSRVTRELTSAGSSPELPASTPPVLAVQGSLE